MESIGHLTGGVAHDFNNLLSVILGNASVLREPGLSPAELSESQQEIIQAAERAATLTRQLLAFSRKQAMQPVRLDLEKVVANVANMLRRIVGENISLVFQAESNLPAIQADPGMIEQILLNITVNSRDAMPGGGKLTISTGTETWDSTRAGECPGAAPGLHVRLTVQDTGSGIAPEDLPHVFEPFFTTKEAGKGTGLGLATVYGIVKQHGGWITVASEINHGTTFRIYFPALANVIPDRMHRREAPTLPCGTETILVVEDEFEVRLIMENMLQRCGYRVLQAESGPAALEVWREREGKIALLLTDIVLPGGMTGHELALQLQAADPGLKIIYTSGYAPDSLSKHLRLVEGVNFLPKPYHHQTLAHIVRNALDQIE